LRVSDLSPKKTRKLQKSNKEKHLDHSNVNFSKFFTNHAWTTNPFPKSIAIEKPSGPPPWHASRLFPWQGFYLLAKLED
jgi:hypothetical protein